MIIDQGTDLSFKIKLIHIDNTELQPTDVTDLSVKLFTTDEDDFITSNADSDGFVTVASSELRALKSGVIAYSCSYTYEGNSYDNADQYTSYYLRDPDETNQPSDGGSSGGGSDQYYTKEESDARYANKEDVYTKSQINSKGYLTSETDPVFSASPAHNITNSDISNWNSKTSNIGTVTGVKMNGTTKNPTNGIVNLGTVITDTSDKQDVLVSGTNIKTINNQSILGSGNISISSGTGGEANVIEAVSFNGTVAPIEDKTAIITATIPTALSELTSDSTHRTVTDAQMITWNSKQAAISDLINIRTGASLGASAVQPSDLATVATSGSYNDLSNKPTIPTALADLSADTTHRTVTDAEKAAWNGKAKLYAIEFYVNDSTQTVSCEYSYSEIIQMLNSNGVVYGYDPDGNIYQYAYADMNCVMFSSVDISNGVLRSIEFRSTNEGEFIELDIPTTLADLQGDATHRVVTDAEKASWNDKANMLSTVVVSGTGAVTQALDTDKFYKFDSVDSLALTLNAPSTRADGTVPLAIYAGKFTASSNWGGTKLSIPATVSEATNNDEIEANGTYEFSIMDNIIIVREI